MNRFKLAWAALREGMESAWFELTYRAPKELTAEVKAEIARVQAIMDQQDNTRFVNSGESKIAGKETSQ